jgi:hypothetical protein
VAKIQGEKEKIKWMAKMTRYHVFTNALCQLIHENYLMGWGNVSGGKYIWTKAPSHKYQEFKIN